MVFPEMFPLNEPIDPRFLGFLEEKTPPEHRGGLALRPRASPRAPVLPLKASWCRNFVTFPSHNLWIFYGYSMENIWIWLIYPLVMTNIAMV